MSANIRDRAASAGVWFGAISLLTQLVSWALTFWVIRLLDPQDFGLMTMAALLTSYLQMFGGLGLGAAIVHRDSITPRATVSVFWFSLSVGCALAVVAFLLAEPTALMFEDDRLMPVTRLVSLLFVISALGVVPNSLLVRNLGLRKVAVVNLVATLVSSTLSVFMAQAGWGVYTLIWTNIILNSIRTAGFFVASQWLPSLHFDREEVMPYLRYGLYLAFSGTFQRLFQTLDKFIVGRFFGAAQLGIYDNAMTIASMPVDKIWPIYQQVVFPLLARLQHQGAEAYSVCLGVLRHYLLLVSPIYLGAAITAPELIELVLGEKWLGMIPWFRAFCLVKIFETLVSYHSTFYNATGRQRQVTRFSLLVLVTMPAAILSAAAVSFEAVVIPWITLYPLLCISWIALSLRRNGFSVRKYAFSVWEGMKAALAMSAALVPIKAAVSAHGHLAIVPRLCLLVFLAAAVFCIVLLIFQRPIVKEAIRVLTTRRAETTTAG